VGDFNADKHNDLAVGAWGQRSLYLLLGHGDGTFDPPKLTPLGSNTYIVMAADFDGNRRDDVGIVEANTGNANVLFSNPDGTLQPYLRLLALDVLQDRAFAADLDGDGRTDVVCPSNGKVSVHFSAGGGNFDPVFELMAPRTYAPGVVADID